LSCLVDSDWVADGLAGRPAAVNLLTTLSEEGIAISLMTYGEIYEGIHYGNDPQQAEAGFRNFLRNVAVLPFTRSIMRCFARIRGELRRSGQIIGDPDILIAATALEQDLTLVSRNQVHFERIPGLRQHPAPL
jgi:tRNA(fMet)-specific endonuclease VapC